MADDVLRAMLRNNDSASSAAASSQSNQTRRGMLKTVAGVSAGIVGIGAISDTTNARNVNDGGDPPYYETVQSSHSTTSPVFDHLKIHLTTTAKYGNPYYDDHLNTEVVDIQVDSEAAVFHEDDPSTLESDHIDWNTMKITYPDNKVNSGKSQNWIGGMANYDDPEDPGAQEEATAIIAKALEYSPYFRGASEAYSQVRDAYDTAKLLDRVTTPAGDDDHKKWSWDFSGAKRINTWVRFQAEVGEVPAYEIDIRNDIGGSFGTTNNFSLFVSE